MEQGAQLTELNGSGVWQHSNIYASGGRLVATYDAPSQPVPGYHYNLTDWLGTKRVQTTAGGGPQETCLSYPFGDGLACSGGTDATEQHFTGKDRDAESGLDYFYARYYNSNLGRFLTPDRAAKPAAVPYASYGDPQSLNLYAYVNNNPNTGIDVDGHVGNDGETFVSDDGPGGVDTMEEEEGMNAGISIAEAPSAFGNPSGSTTTSGSGSQPSLPTPFGDDGNAAPKPATFTLNPTLPIVTSVDSAATAAAILSCEDANIAAVNSVSGLNISTANVVKQDIINGALNVKFSVPGASESSLAAGRYPSSILNAITGIGSSLHAPPAGGNDPSTYGMSNGNFTFTTHIDSAYATWHTPVGAAIHGLRDVMDHGANRQLCGGW